MVQFPVYICRFSGWFAMPRRSDNDLGEQRQKKRRLDTTNLRCFLVAAVLLAHADDARTQLPALIDLSQTSADVEILGTASSDHSGYSLASGDFDGDGLIDLAIFSTHRDPLGPLGNGEVEIIWAAGLQIKGVLDMASGSVAISRIFVGNYSIFSQLGSGDFNNDGIDDLVLLDRFGFGTKGIAQIVFGSVSFPDTLDLVQDPPADLVLMRGPQNGSLGWATCDGDVNGDGYDDLIISAPRIDFGEVFIIPGDDSLDSFYDLDLPQPSVTRIIGNSVESFIGASLDCRDINNDGFADVLIGWPVTQLQGEGGATVLYGQPTLPDTIDLADSSYQTKKIYGEADPVYEVASTYNSPSSPPLDLLQLEKA